MYIYICMVYIYICIYIHIHINIYGCGEVVEPRAHIPKHPLHLRM